MSIKIDNITFRYDKKSKPVLDEFSAEFFNGQMTALTGKNGSGKTTLSRVIMGISKAEKGTVLIDGEDSKNLSLAETGRKIGYVMQNPARQIFSTSVREEIMYGLENLGLEDEEKESRAKEYLDYFDLSGREDDFPFSLSHGEKQRLVLASVLAMKPNWLMLDEPTASLDYMRREQLGEYLLKINREQGCGIIIISHDRDFVERYTGDRIRIEGGRHV